MNILHYNLGLPPFRSGGLTKYSIDLALEQLVNNNVYLLFPGGGSIFLKKDKITKKFHYKGMECYKIENSLPVPLLLGISEPKSFFQKFEKETIRQFFLEKKIEIFHIHTFMGLNKEFLEVAKELEIKIIYTTHDYFGICPKVNLLDHNFQICESIEEGQKCLLCNIASPSTFKLNLLSIGVHKIYKKLKKILKIKIKTEKSKVLTLKKSGLEYLKLRERFLKTLELVDVIHYNSKLTKEIYEKYSPNKRGEVILISHKGLKMRSRLKKTKSSKLRLGYFGTTQKIKGFEYLCNEIEEISENLKKEIEIYVYGIEKKDIEDKINKSFIFKGTYKSEELTQIHEQIDYTIIPSICLETFNLVSLESKFYNTPVIISDKVGAKEIFSDEEKIEFKTKKNHLKIILEDILRKKLKKKIIFKVENTWSEHLIKIQDLYDKVLENKKSNGENKEWD